MFSVVATAQLRYPPLNLRLPPRHSGGEQSFVFAPQSGEKSTQLQSVFPETVFTLSRRESSSESGSQ